MSYEDQLPKSPARECQIPCELGKINEQVTFLREGISALTKRLEKALNSRATQPKTVEVQKSSDANPVELCPLATELRAVLNNLKIHNENILRIYDNLEL